MPLRRAVGASLRDAWEFFKEGWKWALAFGGVTIVALASWLSGLFKTTVHKTPHIAGSKVTETITITRHWPWIVVVGMGVLVLVAVVGDVRAHRRLLGETLRYGERVEELEGALRETKKPSAPSISIGRANTVNVVQFGDVGAAEVLRGLGFDPIPEGRGVGGVGKVLNIESGTGSSETGEGEGVEELEVGEVEAVVEMEVGEVEAVVEMEEDEEDDAED